MEPHAARVGLVALRGSFTVASSHKLVEVIGADIKDHEVVIFDFSGATYLDDSAAMVIEQLIAVAAEARTGVIVMGLSGSVANTLHARSISRSMCRRNTLSKLWTRRGRLCVRSPRRRPASHLADQRNELQAVERFRNRASP